MARECQAQLTLKYPIPPPQSSASDVSSANDTTPFKPAKKKKGQKYHLRTDDIQVEITAVFAWLLIDFKKVLGQGASGTVFHARIPETGQDVAAKIVPYELCGRGEWGKKVALKELELHQKIWNKLDESGNRCPHILPLVKGFSGPGFMCLATPLMKRGTIGTLIKDRYLRVGAPVPLIKKALVHLAKGALHFHNCGVIHCDIKPGNVFVHKDESGESVFQHGDFGEAVEVKDEVELRGGGVGTDGFIAFEREDVEVIKGKYGLEEASKGDSFAIGMVGLCLLLGWLGLPKNFDPETRREVIKARLNNRSDERLLYALVDPNLSKRHSVAEFLRMAWPSERRNPPPPVNKVLKRKRVEEEAVAMPAPPPQQPMQNAVNAVRVPKKPKTIEKGKENKKAEPKKLHKMSLKARNA